MSLLSDIAADLAVLEGPKSSRMMNRGFHALIGYRIARALALRKVPLIPMFLTRIVQILYGIDLDYMAQIAPGVRIFHGMGLVIGWGAIIGSGCTFYHGVTIGQSDVVQLVLPTLGKNVWVFAGAKVLGPITIGDGARIGANAVVTKDVPAGALAVGVPARIVSRSAPIDEAPN